MPLGGPDGVNWCLGVRRTHLGQKFGTKGILITALIAVAKLLLDSPVLPLVGNCITPAGPGPTDLIGVVDTYARGISILEAW